MFTRPLKKDRSFYSLWYNMLKRLEGMLMKKSVQLLSAIAAMTTILSALLGLFYTYGGKVKTVTNIYGQNIELFGDGIYSNNSLLKVGATKGTDIVMIMVSLLLLLIVVYQKRKPVADLLQTGLLSCLLYASTCLVMGISFNVLFPLYLIQFSSSLFAFVLALSSYSKNDPFKGKIYEKKLIGTSIFLILGGSSVLVWLTFIIPAIITGVPTEFIEIYTTEPTFVIDLGIIFPVCLYSGIALLKKKKIAYVLASVLMTLITCVGCCVIAQTMMQSKLGIVLSPGQVIGLVFVFVMLGAIAIRLNYKLLKEIRE